MSPQKKQLFILDPLEALDPRLDSSLQLAQALQNLGIPVYFTTLPELFWDSHQQSAACKAYELKRIDNQWQAGTAKDFELQSFHTIHMRKDPPFDMHYVAATWFLESAAPRTKIINSPMGLRKYNEKVATLYFPQYALPSLVSQDPDALFTFLKDACAGEAILKPLDLYGGRGIEYLSSKKSSDAELKSLIRQHLKDHFWRLIQPFQEAISAGEVRAFVAFGEPIAWCLKVPKAGGFLANTRAGASLEAYQPTPEETAAVVDMSRELQKDGIEWVGYDLIGGKVSEINITSPRLLCAKAEEYAACFAKMAQQIVMGTATF